MTRYAVLGTGALGGLYGGLLARAGFEVHFLLHSDYAYVKEHGLRVDTPLGDFHLPQIQAYADASQMPAADVVIVAWKSTQNHLLAETLAKTVKPNGCVLVLQNGWDVERAAADAVGEGRVLGGCCFLCSNKIGPGHIRHLDYGRITFGEYEVSRAGNETERMRSIAEDFSRAGIDIVMTSDLRRSRWTKLMWNIPFNGLSVVLDSSTDRIMADENSSTLAAQLMDEVRAAAAACGSVIEEPVRDKLLADTVKMVPYASSMLLDYQQRRPMEVEAIFGNTVRAAQAAGARVPRIEMLTRQLRFLDSANRSELATSSPKG
ncbi:MAG: putative 2-dehydropantoate 2-reductase [Pirellulales bacterium]